MINFSYYVLSAEIIVIALGTLVGATLEQKIAVLSVIAIGMTVGVYGLVAMIVKLDDVGLYWQQLKSGGLGTRILNKMGSGLLVFAPRLMQSLAFIGLIAMFLVGGGMLTHNIPMVHHLSEVITALLPQISWLTGLVAVLLDGLYGLIAGLLIALLLHFIPLKKSAEQK